MLCSLAQGFSPRSLLGLLSWPVSPRDLLLYVSPGQGLYTHVPAQLFLNLGFGARTQGHAHPVDRGSSVVDLSL